MAQTSNVCRLCVDTCSESKSLYDEKGRPNELCEITLKYFHPTIVNLQEAKQFRIICLSCWRCICDFHSFQTAIMLAQLKLLEFPDSGCKQEVKNDEDEMSNNLQENVTILEPPQNEEDVIIVEGTHTEAIPPTLMVEQNSNVASSSTHDTRTAVKSPLAPTLKTSASCSQDTSIIIQSLPVLEIIDLDSDIDLNSDDEMPLAKYANKSQTLTAAKTTVLKSSSHPHIVKPYRYLDDSVAKWLPNIECHVCRKSYNRLSFFKKHFQLKHPNEVFQLSCCSSSLRSCQSIRSHMRLHDNPNAFKCGLCDKCYSYASTLQLHMTKKHPESSGIACRICGEDDVNKKDLLLHYTTEHKIEPGPKAVIQDNGRTVYPCSECEKMCHNRISYYNHVWLTHKYTKPNFKCTMCRRGFRSALVFRRHVAAHKCTLCSNTFNKISDALRHRILKHPSADQDYPI